MPFGIGGFVRKRRDRSGKVSRTGRWWKSSSEEVSPKDWRESRRGSRGSEDKKARRKHGSSKKARYAGAASDFSGGRSASSRQSAGLLWSREAASRASGASESPILARIRSKVPWRAGSRESALLHPLRRFQFWELYFGSSAVVLRRGPWHPGLFTPAIAAGQLRSYKLGVDADVMGPHMFARSKARPGYSPEVGLPAVAALARGRPVRLRDIERRSPRLLRGDILPAQLARLAPGRGVSASLHWTPPRSRAVWEHEDWYHQVIVQIYGVRRWTVCRRGVEPPSRRSEVRRKAARGARHEDVADLDKAGQPSRERTGPNATSQCTSAVLRRGDVMYIPPRSWHWTGAGLKASSHLEIGVLPLLFADLVISTGARDRVRELAHPLMSEPLPLWLGQVGNITEAVANVCVDLPWVDPPRDIPVLCGVASLQQTLRRIGAIATRASRRHPYSFAPPPPPDDETDTANIRRYREKRAKSGILSPLMEVLRPASQIFAVICGLLVLMWLLVFCVSDTSDRERRERAYKARAMKDLAGRKPPRPRKVD